MLATPYRGRAIPFSFLSYSSRTIAEEERSRNINHWRAFDEIKALLGDRRLVLDREFSYLEILQYLAENHLSFVIRLDLGSHPPVLLDATGKRMALTIAPGQQVVIAHNRISSAASQGAPRFCPLPTTTCPN